jgi:hypothetical protein
MNLIVIYIVLFNIPESGKFRKKGLRNEDSMHVMFEDITTDGIDHILDHP